MDNWSQNDNESSSSSGDERSEYNSSSFFSILKDSGLRIRKTPDGIKNHVLQMDQSKWIKKITKELEIMEPQILKSFVTESISYLDSSNAILEMATRPIRTSKGCTNARAQYQDSLITLLLALKPLQKNLFLHLSEKIGILSLEEDHPESMGLVRNILSQFSFIPWIDQDLEPCEKYMEVLDVVPDSVQMEMIAALPEIFPPFTHEKISKGFGELISRCGDLLVVILDCLTNLDLNPIALEDLRHSTLKMLPSTSLKHLPVILKFALSTSGPESYEETIKDIREQLDLSPTFTSQNTEVENINFKSFEAIEHSFRWNKSVSEAWIKTIQTSNTSKNHCPLDIVVLIVLSGLPNRSKAAISLFRNKLRQGCFTEELISKAISQQSNVFKKNLDKLLNLVDVLMNSNEQLLHNSASILIKQAFVHLDSFCRQEIVSELVNKICGPGSGREVALSCLVPLAFNHTELLNDYAIFTISILENIDGMTLSQVRRIIDVISRLAYFKTPNSLQDDLHIVLSKLIGGIRTHQRRMGIVGSLITVKNMANSSTEDSMTNEESISLSQFEGSAFGDMDPTTARIKEAKDILVKVRISANKHGELSGLFMDELSHIVRNHNLNPLLEKWISRVMLDDFQSEFISDVVFPSPTPDDDFLPHILRWNLDQDIEDKTIALNLGPIFTKGFRSNNKSKKEGCAKTARIIPHFRLLKTCVSVRSGGDLSDIDALLSCPIWFPDSIIDKYDILSEQEQEATITLHFYAINWFRELLNSFAPAEDLDYRSKVVLRLLNLIDTRADLIQLLNKCPGYSPPSILSSTDISDWSPPSVPKPKPPKSKKAKLDLEEMSQVRSNFSQFPIYSLEVIHNLESQYAPFFRELDFEAFLILSYDTITIDLNTSIDSDNPKIRAPQLKFFLEDLFRKFDRTFISKTAPKAKSSTYNPIKDFGYSNLDSRPVREVVGFGVKIMDYLLANLEIIDDFCGRMKRISESETQFFDSNTPLCFQCSRLIYGILAKLFSWNGFASKSYKSVLKTALSKMAARVKAELTNSSSLKDLIENSLDYIKKFKSNIFCDIETGSSLLRLLDSLGNLDDDEDSSSQDIVSTADDFLKIEWKTTNGSVDKGLNLVQNIEYILRKRFVHSPDETILNLLEIYVDEMKLVLETKKSSNVYTSLNSGTLKSHYKITFENLVMMARTLANSSPNKNKMELLDSWNQAISILHKLVLLIKIQSSHTFVSVTSKQSKIFLELFVRQGMPLVDKLFSTSSEDILATLKNLQKVTRYLQHVCTYSKVQKGLAVNVPALKKVLEAFVYRVKVCLAYNDRLDAFLLGNLKNRDLHGVEIVEEESSGEDSDEDQQSGDEQQSEVECGSDEEGISIEV